MRKILVLNGHPGERSLNQALANAYAEAARTAGHEVREVHIHDLDFDPDFGQGGFKASKPLEPQLREVLDSLKWADHLVLVSPMWWGGLPAKLKGLIDRTLLPGETFDPRQMKNGLPTPLLTGRTARLILTSDTPGVYFKFMYANALIRQVQRQILGYVGIKPTRVTHFSPASHAGTDTVFAWLETVYKLGTEGQ